MAVSPRLPMLPAHAGKPHALTLSKGVGFPLVFVMTMFPYQLHVYTSITPEIEPPEVGSLHLGECVVVLQARCMYARSR